ncbi:MAG: hypothetical protein V4632_10850 [Pseudomonadota bacterium]
MDNVELDAETLRFDRVVMFDDVIWMLDSKRRWCFIALLRMSCFRDK